MTILAKQEIIRCRTEGSILIEPFNEQMVSNSSVDVTLGPWFWVENDFNSVDAALNPYDQESVMQGWRYKEAETTVRDLPGIPKGSRTITLLPGQNALCATNEFIGGVDRFITTMMKARSSIGRNQITVCRCAGMGDVGYSNRWTLEITNNGKRPVILVVGRRIAQIVFIKTTGLSSDEDAYSTKGKYQRAPLAGLSLEELESQWKPADMIPKMWLDREARTR